MYITRPSKLLQLIKIGSALPLFIAVGSAGETNLPELRELLPQSCYIAGEFLQRKQLADIPQALESNGEFIFACNQGLIWRTLEPLPETLIYRRDGKHQLLLPDIDAERLKGRVHQELGKILNNLIGADLDYLNEHFDDARIENHHVLTPRNKRLRKFINNIVIKPEPEGTHISILQQKQETTDITITQTQSFDAINADNCPELFRPQARACSLLFQ